MTLKQNLFGVVFLTLSVLMAACGGGGGGGGSTPPLPTPLPDSSYSIDQTTLVQFGTTGDEVAETVIQDTEGPSGHLYVVGSVKGASFGDWEFSKGGLPPVPVTHLSAGTVGPGSQYDGFVAKFDTSGVPLWLRQVDATTVAETINTPDDIYDIAYDDNGTSPDTSDDTLLIAGSNGDVSPFILRLNASDGFIDLLDPADQNFFANFYQPAEAFAIAVDLSAGHVFVAGYNSGIVGTDDPGLPEIQAFVSRLDIADLSTVQQTIVFPSADGQSLVRNLAIDTAGKKLYAMGGFDTASSAEDTFVKAFDYTSGALVETGSALSGLAGNDQGNKIAFDGTHTLVAGITDTVSGSVTGVVPFAGFMLKNLSADATYDWIEEIGSDQRDELADIAVDSTGLIHSVGGTSGAVADQSAPSGSGALVVLKDTADNLGYGILDVPSADEEFRSIFLATDDTPYVFGETTGDVVDSPNFPISSSVGRDVFISTYSTATLP